MLPQVIETTEEALPGSSAFSLEPSGARGGGAAARCERLASPGGREVATEPAERPLERLEGVPGRKDLQLC